MQEAKTQCKRSKERVRKRVTKEGQKLEVEENAGARLEKKTLKRRRKEISGSREAEECNESKRMGLEGIDKWDGLDVPHSVLVALSELGFSQPTPIQIHALPPAIRDRRDIVGAAETVNSTTTNH